MPTLTSLKTLLISALVAISPMTLAHAQHDNEYQGERISFTFPTDEEENWGLEEQHFGSTWFFQGWDTDLDPEENDKDISREECITVYSHLQNPEDLISIDQQYAFFFGSDQPENLSITLLDDSPSDRLFLCEGGDLNSAGFGLVRLIVTPQGHHSLAYFINDVKDAHVQLDEKWIEVLRAAELKSLKR